MKLIGKTRKGKNKIHEAGTDHWRIVKQATVLWIQEIRLPQQGSPGILIEPILVDKLMAISQQRWIFAKDDPDFSFSS